MKEYGITIRFPPGCHNVSGRCWMWPSSSWVCYATMAPHWLLHIMKQNGVRYNRRNHRCCKPCLCQVPIWWQCCRPDDGHRSCSAWSCIFSTHFLDGSCDPSRISTGLYRTRPCLLHRQKETWCIEGIHEWCPVSSSDFQPDSDRSHQYLADRLNWLEQPKQWMALHLMNSQIRCGSCREKV